MGLWAGLQARALHLQGTVPVWVTPADATLENQQPSPSRIGSAGSGIEASPWEFTSLSCPSGAPLSHQPCDSSMRVRRRFASDALPCIEISSGILTVSSHHYAIGWFLEMAEQPRARASLRDIRARDHAYPCVLYLVWPPHRRLLPGPKLGLFPSAGEAQGRTRHEAEKLNPSENYFPPVGLFPFSLISPSRLPPAYAPSCLLTTDLFARAKAQGSRRSRCLASTNSRLGQKGRQPSRSYGRQLAGSAVACCCG